MNPALRAKPVPSALSLLTTTFTGPKDRGRAFAVYGAIAGAGGAVGLLLGGALTEYLSWRWTLYVNLIFAAVAFAGGALLLQRQPSQSKPRLDIPGVLLVSGAHAAPGTTGTRKSPTGCSSPPTPSSTT